MLSASFTQGGTLTTLQEYLAQTSHYFSESEERIIQLEDMPFPHMVHAYRKLERELGTTFTKSPLCGRMRSLLRPEWYRLQEQLLKHGSASIMYDDEGEVSKVRKWFYAERESLGKNIKTHLDRKLGVVTGEVVTPAVKVRGVEVGGKKR